MKKVICEKDLAILSSISNLRFMTTNQIHTLHGYKGKYGIIVTRRKLVELENEGYLNSWQPSKYDQKVFYLTKKGAEEVKYHSGYHQVSTFNKSNKTLHQVMVSEVYVKLHEGNGKVKRFALETKVDEDAIADAFVEYQIGQMVKVFFLECDKGTESITQIKTKLDGYNRINTIGLFQRKYGIFPDVYFITESDTRKRSLFSIAEKYRYKIKIMALDDFNY